MTVTFDVLDRFQESKVFQTAQTMNKISRSNTKNDSFVIMETVTFKIRSLQKYLFGFNYSNYVVETDFFRKKSSRTLILATCYSSIQSYFKIDLILTMLYSMFTFYVENHKPFGLLTKNCPWLDRNRGKVSTFSVLSIVYKSAVSTTQKSNYVGCFNLRSWMFVFAHLFPDISIKSTKLHFQSWKKFSPTISLFLRKIQSWAILCQWL